MTRNTTKNDKQEQCDTKHNALKIYLTRKNLLRRTLFLQPTRQRVFFAPGLAEAKNLVASAGHLRQIFYLRQIFCQIWR